MRVEVSRAWAWSGLCGTALLLAAAGCGGDESTSPEPLPGDVGVVAVAFTGAHGPVPGTGVQLSPVDGGLDTGDGTGRTWQLESDSSGVASFPVPHGRYFAYLTGLTGSKVQCSGAGPGVHGDTLVVDAESPTAWMEVSLGTVDVTLDTSPPLEGDPCRFEMLAIGPRPFAAQSAWTTIGAGQTSLSVLGVPPGRYRLDVLVGGHRRASFFRPGQPDLPVKEDTITVVAGEACAPAYRLAPSAVIRGRFDGAMRILAGWDPVLPSTRQVVLWGDDPTHPLGRTDLDSLGGYRFTIYKDASVRISLDSRLGGETWLWGTSRVDARVFEARLGEETVIPTYADAGVVLRVTVPDPVVIPRFEVTAYDAEGRVTAVTASVYSAPGLRATTCVIGGLPPGTAYFEVTPATCEGGWLPRWYRFGTSLQSAVPVELAEGQVTELEMSLVQGGEISGTIELPEGFTYGFLAVCSTRDTTGLRCWQTVSAGRPEFRIRGLEDGTYLLRAQVNDGPRVWSWWYDRADWAQEAETVVVYDHAVVSGLDWRLP